MGQTAARQNAGPVTRDRLAILAAIVALTLLSFFQFPGHTYLASDTQIYVPMLAHIWDPSLLSRDLVATNPHLAYTLYDEITLALRRLTRGSLQAVLTSQQFLFRALQILGVFLLAASFPLTRAMAMLVAALFTLGATIVGPAVLTFEYEPVPRGFAIALVFLAIGLAAQNHLTAANGAAALAFLYHPPSVFPFYVLYLYMNCRHQRRRHLWPFALAVFALLIASRLQPGAAESQIFFNRVSPELERLQRMRTSYVWISAWPGDVIRQYIFLWVISLVAYWRVRPRAGRLFLIGLPVIGVLSMPLSYLLLEKLKWGFLPQFQPARWVLFITALAVILGVAAAIRAGENRRWFECALWFAIVQMIPASPRVFSIGPYRLAVVAALAAVLCLSIRLQRLRWPLIVAAIAPFFVLPGLGLVQNYPRSHSAGLEDLARFARARTPKDAMFLFGDAATQPDPAIFRALAERAVFVDWKSGGQMNYSESIAREWWQRWQDVHQLQFDPAQVARLRALGIDYLVLLTSTRPLPDRQPVFENERFVVYRL